MTPGITPGESLQEKIDGGARVLIDGATGTELERRGVPMHDEAWCGLTAMTHGDTLRQVHLDYIASGAEVVTTDTFGSSKHVLEDSGVGDQFRAVNEAGARIAREAVEQGEVDHPVYVGGSICTSFMAGNEMTPLEPARARANFHEQMEILVDGGVDLLMLEMVLAHTRRVGIEISAEAVAMAAATGLPVWVGISAKIAKDGDTVLLFGSSDPYDLDPDVADVTEPLDERIRPVLEAGASVVGIMHTDVEACEPALRALRTVWQGPMAAYPHSGHWDNPYWNFESVIDPDGFADHAAGWLDAGASILGGCCGIGPRHIETLKKRFV